MKACIFLGYSHASYRCLDPISDKVFLSSHVAFYECSFSAKDIHALTFKSKVVAKAASPLLPALGTFLILPISTTQLTPLDQPVPFQLVHTNTQPNNLLDN